MYKLFDSTNPKLHRFITKFGVSIVNGMATSVEFPLRASAKESVWIGNRITFSSDAAGVRLFAINPVKIERGFFQKPLENGSCARVYGMRVETKNSYHIFYEGDIEYI